jgi:hypothetical protein
MKKLLLCLLLAVTGLATEIADLGQGLGYLRVRAMADALKAVNTTAPLVMDLRHATTTTEAAEQLNIALAARRPSDATLFFLVGPDTPPKLGEVLKTDSARTFVLGVAESVLEPDVIVAQTADDDRRAYAALDQGTPLADLISGKVEKERFDEATLVEEFKNGLPAGMGHAPAKPAEPSPATATPPPARLTDRVLQRAVHLHRALLALKR